MGLRRQGADIDTGLRSLGELLAELGATLQAGADVALERGVSAVHSDSRRITPASLFIALPGARSQGIDYLSAAFDRGAVAALVSEGAAVPERWQGLCIYSADIRRDGALLACAVYGQPSHSLLCFGVTGSNGKTSSCFLLAGLLKAAGHRVVQLTTVAHAFEGWHEDTPNTTPDAALLQSVLASARSRGATAAVIEVSAHGVVLDRITGCRFDGLLFTNLTRDHQDFFHGMEDYFDAKQRLFLDARYHKPGCVAAISSDDAYGSRLLQACEPVAVSFGAGAGRRHVSTDALRQTPEGLSGRLSLDGLPVTVQTDLTGVFNGRNLAGAVALALAAGLPRSAIESVTRAPICVPGRLMQVRSKAPFRVIVDFAHTDAALGNLLDGLREDTPGRLLVLFGAGGDKDPARRQTLPETAFERADLALMTLDNPRSEDPAVILATMQAHWQMLERQAPECAPAMHVEPDRRAAIAWLLARAQPGDTVVLAGKGHETTQIFAHNVETHDDHAIAQAWLEQHYPEINVDQWDRHTLKEPVELISDNPTAESVQFR